MDPVEILIAAHIKIPGPGRCEIVRDDNGCAIWPFGLHGGYGQCYVILPDGVRSRKPDEVHRVVYAAVVGEIPSDWHIDHVWDRGCRSRACFWPGHLETVTPAENARRMGLAIRERRDRPCGHSWNDTRPGRSDCAVCHREREAARYVHRPHRVYEEGRERARVVRELLATGLTPQEVALLVGISRSRVYDIRRADNNPTTPASC